MRTREEILKNLSPLKIGGFTHNIGTQIETVNIELLLDIRDLLKPEVYGKEDYKKENEVCFYTEPETKNNFVVIRFPSVSYKLYETGELAQILE